MTIHRKFRVGDTVFYGSNEVGQEIGKVVGYDGSWNIVRFDENELNDTLLSDAELERHVPYSVDVKDNTTTHKEAVNHPNHYNSHPSGIECIEVVRHMNFNLGNAIKYLWRTDHKDAPIEDLEKAVWYIQDEIARLKKLAK